MLVKFHEIVIVMLFLTNFTRILARSIQPRLQHTPGPSVTTENAIIYSFAPMQDESSDSDSEIYTKNSVPIMIIDVDGKQINEKAHEIVPAAKRSSIKIQPEPVVRSGSIGNIWKFNQLNLIFVW